MNCLQNRCRRIVLSVNCLDSILIPKMSGDEPQPKRAKSELDPIFTNFFRDKERFEQLWSAVTYIKTCGWNKMIFRKINEANAREIVSFSNATCTLTFLDEDPGFVTVGAFFVPAINILDKYCCAHPSIPDNPDEQAVLSILLQYLSSCKYLWKTEWILISWLLYRSYSKF